MKNTKREKRRSTFSLLRLSQGLAYTTNISHNPTLCTHDDDDEDYDDDDDDIVTKDGYGMTNRVKIFITETISSMIFGFT